MSLEVQPNQVPIGAVDSEDDSGSWEIVQHQENASNTEDNISEPEPDEKMSVPEPPTISELDTLAAAITEMGISKEVFDLAMEKMGKTSYILQNIFFVLHHIWRLDLGKYVEHLLKETRA